jgi:archaellum component FlaG (FlaF/FlaG flagellin family)
MKKIVFTLTTVLASSLCITAQTATKAAEKPTTVVQPATSSLAEMTFEKETHDFGTIEYASNGTYEFKFKNTGSEPLIITDAKGSCGCTVPTYPKNVPIKPGETQVIKVTYDTKRPGGFTKTVTINSNAKTPQKVITIKGTVQPAPTEEAFPANGKKEDFGAIPYEKH